MEQILEEIVACYVLFKLTLLFYLLGDMIVSLLYTCKFQIWFYKLLSFFLGILTHLVDDTLLVHNVNLSCCPLSLVLAWVLGAAIQGHFTNELLSYFVDWILSIKIFLTLYTLLLIVKT